MDGAILPLNFYCRNARLCLRKASISRKANLLADELQHLRVFATLVSSTIPLHPLYIDRKSEKPFLELQSQLPEAAQRILELEDSVPPVSPTNTTDENTNRLLETEKSNEQPSQMTVNLLLSSSSRPTSDSVLRVEKKTIISQRAPDKVQQWENSPPNMSETYRFASKSAPSSRKTTPTTQRPKKASDSSAMDHHHHHHHANMDCLRLQPTSVSTAGLQPL
jgi:hypothetical protein